MSSSVVLLWVPFFFFVSFILASLSAPFLPADNVTLFGDAFFINNSISLTRELNCFSSSSTPTAAAPIAASSSSSSSGVGRALYVHPIRFLDSRTNTPASFSSRFSFSIIPSPLCRFGDGMAFLITSNGGYFSLSDGYLGLPEPLSTQDSFVAIEFDTSFDPSLGDINGNHVGIDVNTIVSFASVDSVSQGIDLKSGKEMTAWIEYRDAEKIIRVWVGNSPVRPPRPLLVAQIDLSRHFKEFMHVGFSASNGPGSAGHIVNRWRFKTFGFIPSAIPMDAAEDGDCFMCAPENSNAKRNPFDLHIGSLEIKEMALGLGGLTAVVLAMIVILIISFCLIRKKRLGIRRSQEDQSCRIQTAPMRFSLAEINSATMGFNKKRIIGEGASSTVYQGFLPSVGAVAVKRFTQTNRIDYCSDPFTNEFVTVGDCLRHANLVQLIGWCCEGNEFLLIYEYLPNGSLDKVLHKNIKSGSSLTWEQRLNIVLGVASALTYLHEECERQIIHRDVKASNIMLDSEFNAKLGDFGLAEIYEHSSITREATIPAGTMGYLAPEYVCYGVPTEKTDVYSFGVVMLELATGRKPVDDDRSVLLDWVWDLREKGTLMLAADFRLMGRFNRVEMERMLMVGLSCAHPNHKKRPTVKKAARILRGEAPLPTLPARKPTPRPQHSLPEASQRIMDLGGDDENPSLDDAPWMTPRSHFG
ncbi:L-type lectin-domain containing receptor kinase S.6 [Vitis riparia]|nr:L-type lectin-domain containing receptor kinase S.6 [Vitis riparia]